MPDSVSAMKLPIIFVDDPGIPGTSKFSPGPASKETLDPVPVIPSPIEIRKLILIFSHFSHLYLLYEKKNH